MADYVAPAFKAFVPGSLAFLWLAVIVGGVAMAVPWRAVQRTGLLGLGLITGVYLVLSLPWAASAIAAPLYRYSPVKGREVRGQPASERRGDAVTLVAFDGDYPDGRVAETARLFALLKPARIVVSGSGRFYDAVLAAGVPRGRIAWEHYASTTREQALALDALIEADERGKVVLVASPLHMARARAACEAAGVAVIPSPSQPPDASFVHGVGGLLPAGAALRLSYEALYEYMALAYYDWQGWTAGRDGEGRS